MNYEHPPNKKLKCKWKYIGNCTEEKGESQTAVKGDVVESDMMIYSDKGDALGTRFVFQRVEKGCVVGQIVCPDGL